MIGATVKHRLMYEGAPMYTLSNPTQADHAMPDAFAAHWEHFPHEADMGVRGIGNSRGQAFEQTAMALTAVIVEPESIALREAVAIECAAPDDELLLVDWLNAIVYEMATRRWVFGRFEVRLTDHHLAARAWGEPLDLARHQPAVEVKGATYTALRVAQEPDGRWIAQCVVDV